MRLIDADKLNPDRMTNKGTVAISQSQIAKAPTIQAVPIDVLDKIRAEIEGNMESIIGKYDSSIPKFNMPSYKIERNKTREECISIIDKYRKEQE